MMTTRRVKFALVILALVMGAPVAQMQFGGGSGTGSTGSRAVSPSAVAAIWSHDDPDHASVLEMLVLMRGAPGWYTAEGPGRNGYDYATNSARSTNHAFATTGGVTVAIDSDSTVPNKRLTVTVHLATVYDQPFAPDSLNVVLVDKADTGSPIVQTERIDPRLTGTGDALMRAIRNTPDLQNFIQCPAPLPPRPFGRGPVQVMAMTFCRQLASP